MTHVQLGRRHGAATATVPLVRGGPADRAVELQGLQVRYLLEAVRRGAEAVILLCSGCWLPVIFARQIPPKCEHCGGETWVSVPNLGDEPRWPYTLSPMDRKLLHSFRIDPEV